jgi:hypothetical protein
MTYRTIIMAAALGICGGCAIAVFVNETAPAGVLAATMFGFRSGLRAAGFALTIP